MQSELAKSTVGIDIAKNKASAVQAEADGESYRLEKVGRASAVRTEAEGLAVESPHQGAPAHRRAEQLEPARDVRAALGIEVAKPPVVHPVGKGKWAVEVDREDALPFWSSAPQAAAVDAWPMQHPIEAAEASAPERVEC